MSVTERLCWLCSVRLEGEMGLLGLLMFCFFLFFPSVEVYVI